MAYYRDTYNWQVAAAFYRGNEYEDKLPPMNMKIRAEMNTSTYTFPTKTNTNCCIHLFKRASSTNTTGLHTSVLYVSLNQGVSSRKKNSFKYGLVTFKILKNSIGSFDEVERVRIQF